MMPYINIVILVAYLIMFFAYITKNNWFAMLSGMLQIVIGINLALYGYLGINDFAVASIGVITLGLGAYLMIGSGINEFGV